MPGEKSISNGTTMLYYTTGGPLGMVLKNIGDATDGRAFTFDAVDLWSVNFHDPSKGFLCYVGFRPSDCSFVSQHSSTATSFTYKWLHCQPSASVTLPPCQSGSVTLPVFTVTVSASITTDNAVALTATVELESSGSPAFSLYSIDLPRLRFQERSLTGSLAELAWPFG